LPNQNYCYMWDYHHDIEFNIGWFSQKCCCSLTATSFSD
jgi:hypothetical protein